MRNYLILLVLFGGLSQAKASNSLKEKMSLYPHVAAHRGGGHSLYKNTIAQFEKAYAAGVDIIETDLQITSDNIVVIYHDKRLSKKTNCKGSVSSKTFDELKKCKFNLNSEQIPTFEEVLTWSNGKVIINAEFKTSKAIKPAIDVLNNHNAHDWVYFQTRSKKKRYTEARGYEAKVNLLFEANKPSHMKWVLSLEDPYLLGVELGRANISKENIIMLKSRGLLVSQNSFQFSADGEKEEAYCGPLLNYGFNIVVTDQPKKCVTQRDAFISLP